MNETKRFLLAFLGVYLVIGIAIVWAFGPPGLSSAYEDQYGAHHERYLGIIKSSDYKLWQENAKLHPPSPQLEADIAFVEEYTGRPAFQAEQRRRDIYRLLFEFFNMTTVIVIAVRFGRKPFLDFVDKQVSQIREKIEHSAEVRKAARQARDEAQAKVDGLPQEKQAVTQETQNAIAERQAQIAQETEAQLAHIAQETEDRKHLEARRAALSVKQELVEQAIAAVRQQLERGLGPQEEANLIDEFVRGLERSA